VAAEVPVVTVTLPQLAVLAAQLLGPEAVVFAGTL
jgi:hypothetical protein